MSASPDPALHDRQAAPEPGGRPGASPEGAAATLSSIPCGSDASSIQLALDAMEIGIFEHDGGATAPRFCDRCRDIWGFSPTDDVTPGMILARIHPDDRPLAAPLWEARADGGSHFIEHRIVLPDTTARWLQVCSHVEPSGHLWGVVRDITPGKLREQQLCERNSQLQAFMKGAPAPYAIFDRNMRFVAVTERYAQHFDRSAGELIGRSAEEIFPTMPQHWRDMQRRAIEGAPQRCECEPIRRKDGTHAWVRWELRPWHGADGGIGGVILYSELITERIQADQALRDSRARLELAIHAGQLGVFEYDFTTGLCTWDAKIREIWGFTEDEPVTYEKFLQHVHPHDRDRVDRECREAARGDGSGCFRSEYRVISRPGAQARWIGACGRVSFEGPPRMAGFVQDITDHKHTKLALKQTTRELRRADDRKDLYLATLAHELRNPLAAIGTVAEMLASPRRPAGQLEWMSQVLRRQTGQMVSLLEDLLEISRICSGRVLLKKQDVALSAVAQSALESVLPMIDEKRHHLKVTLPPGPLVIRADPARLSQVLSNLLANAAKYTDPEGDIDLTCAVEGRDLLVRVKDSGIGIAHDDLDKIFTMFWQADGRPGHSRGGLGIGLAFARGIMQLHGGSITAESEGPGHGSELILRLPGCVRSAPAAATGPPAPAARTLTHHRILVADDDLDTASTLEMLLTLSGHEVRVAHGGQEALCAARDFHPDVALLDLSMPGLDGCGVARVLRQEPWASDLRLIAVTGWGQPEVLRQASDAGFAEQLIKPVDPERLRSLLERQ